MQPTRALTHTHELADVNQTNADDTCIHTCKQDVAQRLILPVMLATVGAPSSARSIGGGNGLSLSLLLLPAHPFAFVPDGTPNKRARYDFWHFQSRHFLLCSGRFLMNVRRSAGRLRPSDETGPNAAARAAQAQAVHPSDRRRRRHRLQSFLAVSPTRLGWAAVACR
jgi:hypothetical protein